MTILDYIRGAGMKKHKLFNFGGSRESRFEVKKFDPEKEYAVVRSSICTGEKVAGFKDKTNGHFTEVMLIRSKQDEQTFKETYHVDSLKVEY